ncbi:MAG: energy-coupling factor transporter transmembrane component T [Spirochaetes bacterium]|nr:energy-coupling factor transporter transmembrane component T [Spirochaetota bacterium]
MKSIEFFRNVSIGQYMDTRSPVHALTPITKYLGLLALAVPILASVSWPGVALSFAAALAVSLAARIPVGFLLRGVKPAIPILVFTAVLQVVFAWPGDASAKLLSAGPVVVTAMEVRLAAMTSARMVALMAVIALFTSVTTERETAYGIEDFFAPLARIGFPAHALALAVAMSFRFVPIIAGELEAIVRAQASRGGDFGASGSGPIRKARAYAPLFVPVVVRALERAEILVEAMESRRYSGANRTRYATFKMAEGEILVRLSVAALGVAGTFVGIRFR